MSLVRDQRAAEPKYPLWRPVLRAHNADMYRSSDSPDAAAIKPLASIFSDGEVAYLKPVTSVI